MLNVYLIKCVKFLVILFFIKEGYDVLVLGLFEVGLGCCVVLFGLFFILLLVVIGFCLGFFLG